MNDVSTEALHGEGMFCIIQQSEENESHHETGERADADI